MRYKDTYFNAESGVAQKRQYPSNEGGLFSLYPEEEEPPETVVLMSCLNREESGWECAECGTTNSLHADCCEVCGAERAPDIG